VKNKLFTITPFVISIVVLLNTVFIIFIGNSTIMLSHYLAIVLIIINLYLYIKKYDWGIILTGIILILGTFNVIAFLTEEGTSFFFFIRVGENKIKISTPDMQIKILLILIFYFCINGKVFRNQMYAFGRSIFKK
jgi:hypothetical protein